jgi:hypothetical protein
MAKPVELKFKASIDQESIDRMAAAFREMSAIMEAAANKITVAMEKYVESNRV